jgi:hypothetical protein
MLEAVEMIYQRMKKRHIQPILMEKYQVSYETTKDDYYRAKQYIVANHAASEEDREYERTVELDDMQDLYEEARAAGQYSAARAIKRDIIMLKGLEEIKVKQEVKHSFDHLSVEELQELLKKLYPEDSENEIENT